ncbi:Uncharacterised protein [Mycobacteroides abscessus subsp. abscessus]|nr:Uncharacterised protein [Mycobacteroides abscessus]SHT80891.1 Uncharacterised protein [Mycobacteroides abscessus subsp. abscessus]SKS36324.1 Uncharacterised protein [Mycobacteroides abscessus subsp. abscessus]
MLRDDSVQATHRTSVSSDLVTARASVVLPTPAAPTSTAPQVESSAMAERTAPNSVWRSSNCQLRAMG